MPPALAKRAMAARMIKAFFEGAEDTDVGSDMGASLTSYPQLGLDDGPNGSAE